ncbi:MAG: MFS transporter [Flavobacteriaceae bacterium]|nr:MFS transporter [Flavobacteriaceae bacterium]OUX39239.1 MAG: MFS transporter [Flavobacteriaceae bacterium TMED265]
MTAGESVFTLPFLLPRIFRPTFLEVFQLDNLQLGTLYSTYGIIALVSYLLGGTLADKYDPRKLMGTALCLTALGGLVLAQFPNFNQLQWLYGYWGFSTTFLFWSAMIKATRNWGGTSHQGKAFGFLEGGRGTVAASIGALGIFIFALLIPEDVVSTSFIEKREAFRTLILYTSAMIMLVGVLVFFFLENTKQVDKEANFILNNSFQTILKVSRFPAVGLLIMIVLCAYCGYKVTDILSLYAAEIMMFNEVDAAKVGSYQMYLRPLICIVIGFAADKSSSSKWLIRGFGLLLCGALLFASGQVIAPLSGFFIFSLIITAIATYGLRTLYFASIQEGHIPYAFTGTAVGIISVVGYTPDIFMGPVMGVLLDNYPGLLGHQLVFLLLAIFAFIGMLASLRFRALINKSHL